MIRICRGRTGIGTDTVVVPVGALRLVEANSSNNFALSTDPNVTYANTATPTANKETDYILWVGGLFVPIPKIPVQEGTNLYVAMAAAGTYWLSFETADDVS